MSVKTLCYIHTSHTYDGKEEIGRQFMFMGCIAKSIKLMGGAEEGGPAVKVSRDGETAAITAIKMGRLH